MIRPAALALLMMAQTHPPDVAALVRSALGPGISPYAAVKPVVADFNGDGKADLAVVIDFNKWLRTWLKRGDVILNLDSPSLRPMKPDNEQHYCFGLLVLDGMDPARRSLFYGCFTGWKRVPGAKAALDLDMESGATLRLFYDGQRYRTRVVRN